MPGFREKKAWAGKPKQMLATSNSDHRYERYELTPNFSNDTKIVPLIADQDLAGRTIIAKRGAETTMPVAALDTVFPLWKIVFSTGRDSPVSAGAATVREWEPMGK